MSGRKKSERASLQIASIIEELGIEYFKEIVNRAYMKKEVVNMLGFVQSRSAYDYVETLIREHDIDTSHFKECWNQVPIKEIFIKHKDGKRRDWRQRKRALIKIGRPYTCEWCGNKGVWRGKQMTLEIDHINSDPSDDRKENLRFFMSKLSCSNKKFSNSI